MSLSSGSLSMVDLSRSQLDLTHEDQLLFILHSSRI